MSSDVRPDPIAEARKNWENAGWGDVAGGMQAVTSVVVTLSPCDGKTVRVCVEESELAMQNPMS